MIELTEQQRQELTVPEPIVVDPQTRETYVLIRREAYDRFKALLSLDDYDPDEGAAYVNEIMADDDAKDPYLSCAESSSWAALARIIHRATLTRRASEGWVRS